MQTSRDSSATPIQPEVDHPRNILLIEDRQSDIDLVEEALRESRIQANLNVARDGEEALNFLYQRQRYRQAPRPEVILLDLNLPRINGIELLHIIKEDANLKVIPVIVFTTSKATNDVLRSYATHANCYLVKPPDLEQFFKCIQATLKFWFTVATIPPG